MDDVKLHHPVPTRTTYLPEPPSTPVSPQGYKRFTSSPNPPGPSTHASPLHHPLHAQPHAAQYPVPPTQPYGVPQYQSFAQPGVGSPPQPAYGFVQPAAWGVDAATAQITMQLGQTAVQAGQDYMQKNFGSHVVPLALLKHHFNVSNGYVLHKLRLVLFPWRHRPWARKPALRRADSQQTSQSDAYLPPRDDINSPDLYIPTMALVTYVLLAALQLGLSGHFTPSVLGTTATSALVCILFEIFLVKLGCYLLSIEGHGEFVDLVAYGGYKFVGIILTLVTGLTGAGSALYWGVFLYAFFANAFFLLRSLRYVVLPDPAAAGVGHTLPAAQRSHRVQFLFFIAASQAVYMFFLVPGRPARVAAI